MSSSDTDNDIRERDALAKRIKQRDKDKKKDGSLLKSKSREYTNDPKEIARLRYESRKGYLKKRKDDKLDELELLVKDDETIFSNEV